MLRSFNRLLCLFFCFALYAETEENPSYSIALVHIGPSLPDYAIDALRQARLFNPKAHLILLADPAATEFHSADLALLNVALIPLNSFSPTEEHQEFLKKKSSAQFFWRVTTERFFYLEEWMRENHQTDVFHLETDNLLYADLATLLPIFKKHYSGIAATFLHKDLGIAGLVYFSSPTAIKHFTKFIAKRALGRCDMELLALFQQEESKEAIDHLPVILPSYANAHPLKSISGYRPKTPQSYSNHFSEFQSIFDALPLGLYLGSGHIEQHALFDPRLITFDWELDEEGRKIPFAQFGETRVRINNLHIRCKDLKKFRS